MSTRLRSRPGTDKKYPDGAGPCKRCGEDARGQVAWPQAKIRWSWLCETCYIGWFTLTLLFDRVLRYG